MKKFALISLIIFAFTFVSQAQIIEKRIIGDLASDTLTASATKSYTMTLQGNKQYAFNCQFVMDKVSGTVAYSAYCDYSLDGINWIGIDTVAITGGVDTTFVIDQSTVRFKGTHLRVRVVATSATQKSNVDVYLKTWYFND